VHRGHPTAAAVTQAPAARRRHTPLRALRASLGLFTVVPVRARGQLGQGEAAAALRWLPVTGLLVALPAAGLLLAAETGGHGGPRRLLAATLAIAATGLLTGGLHLDGLADTADGLGSRRQREQALALMRRSDVGPFGVAALVFTLLAQVAALASLPPGFPAAAALVTAAVTGRVAVVLATGPGSPSARPDGFGSLVTGAAGARTRVMVALALLAGATAAGALAGGGPLAAREAAAVAAGLAAAELLRRTAVRRLGGLTGDVYGALIETAATAALLLLALTS
jgi:adenosylcobinamide-GDP ribazoletransferase